MNRLGLITGNQLAENKEALQAIIDKEVERVLKDFPDLVPSQIYTGNIDFMPWDVAERFTHIAFLAGLGETLVIQEMVSHKDIYDGREEA